MSLKIKLLSGFVFVFFASLASHAHNPIDFRSQAPEYSIVYSVEQLIDEGLIEDWIFKVFLEAGATIEGGYHSAFGKPPKSRGVLDSKLIDVLHSIRNRPQALDHVIARLGLDERPIKAGLLDFLQAAYLKHIKSIVNPEGGDKTVVYGGMGSDFSTTVLAFDPKNIYGIDLAGFRADVFEALNRQANFFNRGVEQQILAEYFRMKYAQGGSKLGMHARYFEARLLSEMLAAGVEAETIEVVSRRPHVRIKFQWAYAGARPRERFLTLISADMTRPQVYPAALRDVLQEGIFDIYYQKALASVPFDYRRYLPYVAQNLPEDGFLVTGDWAQRRGIDMFLRSMFLGPSLGERAPTSKAIWSLESPDRMLNKVGSFANPDEFRTQYMLAAERLQGIHRFHLVGGRSPAWRLPHRYWWHLNVRQKLAED